MQLVAVADANIIDVVAYPFMTDLEDIVAATPASEWGKYENRLKIGLILVNKGMAPGTQPTIRRLVEHRPGDGRAPAKREAETLIPPLLLE